MAATDCSWKRKKTGSASSTMLATCGDVSIGIQLLTDVDPQCGFNLNESSGLHAVRKRRPTWKLVFSSAMPEVHGHGRSEQYRRCCGKREHRQRRHGVTEPTIHSEEKAPTDSEKCTHGREVHQEAGEVWRWKTEPQAPQHSMKWRRIGTALQIGSSQSFQCDGNFSGIVHTDLTRCQTAAARQRLVGAKLSIGVRFGCMGKSRHGIPFAC